MEQERPRILAEKETYFASEEYKKVQASFKEKDDDDDYKYDKDPSGYDLISKVVGEGVYSQHLDFIIKVYKSNTKDSRFLAKAVKLFVKLGRFELIQEGLDKLKAIKEEIGDLGEHLYARAIVAKAQVPEDKLKAENPQDLKNELDSLQL